ncbi:MAG: hypothetical protein H7X97_13460 [Opitutaceae bacterium]|nr:hypothetical protein [Verrucomicrobiales bacterium]
MNDLDRLKYDALSRQLDRLRVTQQTFTGRFFHLLIISGVVMIAACLVNNPISYVALPYLLITTGVQSCFYLYHTDFARLQARAVEANINLLLGEKLITQGELEEDYFHTDLRAAFGELTASRMPRFFAAFTLHFLGVWLLVMFWSWYNLFLLLMGGRLVLYVIIFVLWATANFAYLYWHLTERREEKRLVEKLREIYGPTSISPESNPPPRI